MRLLYLLVALFPGIILAQPTTKGWQELTISDGLSQGMIYDLKQDRKGFIWVATKDGLNRYDGHNFTVFTHDPYNHYSLSDNNCSTLLIDSRGWLWVGTLNQGLNLFDTRMQRFFHLDIRDQASPKAGNYEINRINEDPEGNIWVTANLDKLFKVTLTDALKTRFPSQPNLTDQVQIQQVPINETVSRLINYVSFSPEGHALAVSFDGIGSFNWHYPKKAVTFTPFGRNLNAVYVNANQKSWFATNENSVVCYWRGVMKTIPLPKRKYIKISLHSVDSATLAIADGDLLWLMSPDELVRQDSLTARNAFATLPPNIYNITNIISDQTGNIWVGTSGYGLRKFNPKTKQFHSTLPNTTFSYLYADRQGRIYMRHEFAYGQFDRVNNRMVPFLSNDLPPPDRRQRFMLQDRKGTFWVSNVNFETHQMHLFKFSADWKLLKKYPLPANTSFGFYGNQTIEDKAGRLWIGAINGKLLRFDPETETFRLFSYQSLVPQKGSEIETYTLYFDQANTLWITTRQGMIRATHTETIPKFSIYKNSQTDRQSLSNDFVLSLADDPYEPARYLWVGTKGGGLDRLDKQTGHFDHIGEADGLPNKVVYGILVDEFKSLWLSTNRGLAQFNVKTRTFRNYTKADGLQDDEFNTGSFVKTPSGELLFGGVNGLTTFRASGLVGQSKQKPIANIIGLKVNNEPIKVGGPDGILSESIEHTGQLDLSHTQNLLTLEFGVMDYTNSAKNRYRYRLEGIDENWVNAGANRFANYAQLPDGSYTLQMTGSPDGEVWSQPVELHVQVHPPFYRTWWAYLVYLIVLAVIGWLLYRFQTQRLLLQQQVVFEQKEASRLAELDALKTQFFTNISHEFRTPLTLILGPVEQAVQDYNHDARFPLIQRNANRLLSLINQLLDLSKLEAGQLRPEPEPGDMAAFFRTLASSFSSLAESRRIRFLFTQNEPTRWASFDRDKVEKIVTNLLANAFKFTPAGNVVRMDIQYESLTRPGEAVLTIADTGIGIAPAHLPHIFERFYQGSVLTGSVLTGSVLTGSVLTGSVLTGSVLTGSVLTGSVLTGSVLTGSVPTVPGKNNRPYEGTGIGLALVNELVKVLGGSVSVASTQGVGTTFTITLPLTEAAPACQPPEPLQSAGANRGPASPRPEPTPNQAVVGGDPAPVQPTADNILLIIDDNADIRAYIRSIFDADYQIFEAEDGQDGLAQATAQLPDIVICDLMMPRLDGFGFCKALKTQETTSHIPVVMLTAKATVANRMEGFELGADDYLTKPFNRGELLTRVRNLVEQRQRLYRHFVTNSTVSAEPSAPIIEPAKPVEPTLLAAKQKFLDRLSLVVMQHIDQNDFTVEDLALAVTMSRVQLHRKLKTLTNTSATHFIRDIRLAKAAQLLNAGETVTQVAYAVGFDNLSYFAKVFQERYGMAPSQYGKVAAPLKEHS